MRYFNVKNHIPKIITLPQKASTENWYFVRENAFFGEICRKDWSKTVKVSKNCGHMYLLCGHYIDLFALKSKFARKLEKNC